MLILDLCGGTGAWSKPYADTGYDVVVVDPIADGNDVRLFQPPTGPVRGVLAAPPCTMFASSGARWKRTEEQMIAALSVVDACLRIVRVCQPVWWALENPVGTLQRWIGQPLMYFDPCDYGDSYTKKTCLWGNFNVPAQTPVEPTEGSKMHLVAPGPDRQRIRSQTPPGFARAFFEANP